MSPFTYLSLSFPACRVGLVTLSHRKAGTVSQHWLNDGMPSSLQVLSRHLQFTRCWLRYTWERTVDLPEGFLEEGVRCRALQAEGDPGREEGL